MPSARPPLDPTAGLASIRARVSHLDQAVTLRGRTLRAVWPKLGAPAAVADDRGLLAAMVGVQGVIVVLALVAGGLWLTRQPGPPPDVAGGGLLAGAGVPADEAAEPDPAVADAADGVADADDVAVTDAAAADDVVAAVDATDADVADAVADADAVDAANGVDPADADDAVADAVATTDSAPRASGRGAGGPPVVDSVRSFPASVVGDTRRSSTSLVETYSCAPGKFEGGTEEWYEVVIPQRGLFTAWVSEEPRRDVDVDLHLLTRADAEHCIRRGHSGVAATLEAGTYWLVIDTFTGRQDIARPGPYTLRMTLAPR